MTIPTWVDFESAERSAAVMARGLSGSSEAWGRLLANAQAVLASRTDIPHSEQRGSYDFDEWRDLVAAARILDLAATELGLENLENRKTAAILAACAFGMSGTAVSSTAIIRGHRLLDSDLSPGELAALALSSPVLSREIFPKLPEGIEVPNLHRERHGLLGKRRRRTVCRSYQGASRGISRRARSVGRILIKAQPPFSCARRSTRGGQSLTTRRVEIPAGVSRPARGRFTDAASVPVRSHQRARGSCF